VGGVGWTTVRGKAEGCGYCGEYCGVDEWCGVKGV